MQNSRQSKSIEHLPEHEGGVFTPQLFFQFPKDHSRSLKINMCLEHGVYTIYHHIPPYTIIYHHISSYTIIYHHMPSYTIIYHHIPSYTIIYHHIPSYTIDPSYNIIYIYHTPSYTPFTPKWQVSWGTSLFTPFETQASPIEEQSERPFVAENLNPSW